MKITGKFDVKLNPLDFYAQGENGIKLGRMSIDKTFHGDLDATSKGEMLNAMTSVKGSAGYVAIEQVAGTLSGKKGPSFEHWFVGNSALSGLRTSMHITRAWYERLYRIFPNIQFQIRNVAISGLPWNTLVTVEWTDSYTLLNGEKRDNCGVHLIRLKWGKGTSVRIYCDTSRLDDNLAIQFNAGVMEASAAPLGDAKIHALLDTAMPAPTRLASR